MFQKLGLSDEITTQIEGLGFTSPTKIQEESIPVILSGKDVVGRSQTGSGKTFAFGLPAIQMVDKSVQGVETLIVCPTRELASQVCDEIKKVATPLNIKVVPVYGGADITRQIIALRTAKIVVGTPGRIQDHLRRRTLKLNTIKMVVLDEADEMLDMGFKEDIETILTSTPKTRQTVMFSATMPPAILAITKNYQNDPVMVKIGGEHNPIENLNQSYVYCKRDGKVACLVDIFKTLKPAHAIVFCNTIRMVDEIASVLNKEGISALGLHGDMRQGQRKTVMNAIKSTTNRANLLVATDVAARGIDINDIDYVINFDLPNNIEYYIHRIGRTGRAGKSGNAISLINTKGQLALLHTIEEEMNTSISCKVTSFSTEVPTDLREYSNEGKNAAFKKSNNRSKPPRGAHFNKGGRFDKGETVGRSDRKPFSRDDKPGDRRENRGSRYESNNSRSATDKPFARRDSSARPERDGERKTYTRRDSTDNGAERKPYASRDAKDGNKSTEPSKGQYGRPRANDTEKRLPKTHSKQLSESKNLIW